LKKNNQILIIFGTQISDTTDHQLTFSFPTSSNVCFCTTWKNRTDKICIKINQTLYEISSFWICGHWQPINYKVWLLCSSTSVK